MASELGEHCCLDIVVANCFDDFRANGCSKYLSFILLVIWWEVLVAGFVVISDVWSEICKWFKADAVSCCKYLKSGVEVHCVNVSVMWCCWIELCGKECFCKLLNPVVGIIVWAPVLVEFEWGSTVTIRGRAISILVTGWV